MTYASLDDFDLPPDLASDGSRYDDRWSPPVRAGILIGVAPMGWLIWGILVFGLQKLIF